MNRVQCRWCGKFGAHPITRTIRDWRGRWSTVRQELCPDCESEWTTDLPWNKPVDPALPVVIR